CCEDFIATDETRIEHGSEAKPTLSSLPSVFHPCFIRGYHFFCGCGSVALSSSVVRLLRRWLSLSVSSVLSVVPLSFNLAELALAQHIDVRRLDIEVVRVVNQPHLLAQRLGQ